MKIGLIDVDGHNFPNLALMKISSFHKSKGDEVEFVDLFKEYDVVYQSKVFTFTNDYAYTPKSNQILKGGTGYDLKSKLPYEIEHQYPDYSLYGITDTAYGYLTRGCPRGCEFCIVADKEGKKSYKVTDLSEFWNGQKEIKLLDPNILASNDNLKLLKQLVDSKAWIDFTQGLDIRLMTDEATNLIKQLKVKMLHFAWDNMKQNELILNKLTEFKKATGINYRKLKVYMLTNFDTTIEEDLYRIYKLKELGYDPYVMIYEKDKLPRGHKIKKMQRWVNNKIIFRSGKAETFEDYLGIS
jgi:hypothetical protein